MHRTTNRNNPNLKGISIIDTDFNGEVWGYIAHNITKRRIKISAPRYIY